MDNQQEKIPAQAQELYEQFMDARSVRLRRELLQKMKREGCLTDKMIDDFAVVMDLVIRAGDFEERYYDLLGCMDSMARFETTGLR